MASNLKVMYIYLLPYKVRQEICYVLDEDNKWEELGTKFMHFDESYMNQIKKEVRRGKSGSDELLTLWGNLNHTVTELFILLNYMGLYPTMTLLKPFVDEKYHKLIKQNNAEEVKVKRPQIENSKIASNNFDKDSLKSLQKKTCMYSDENNESPELLNAQKESTNLMTKHFAGEIPLVSYKELTESTNNWNEAHILGRGGFGIVYKGTWKYTSVAIKNLETRVANENSLKEQIRQSVTELQCLNAYRHDNILPLYGYSIDGVRPCLLYQYMPGGSLDKRLRPGEDTKKALLSWTARMQIALGIAKGINFLHTTLRNNKPLIHGDIKSPNILLDCSDQPKIGDFGLAREGPTADKTSTNVTRIYGTIPYLPSEFLRSGKLSTKVDIFSFGVVLFELVTSRPAYFQNHYLVNIVLKSIESGELSKIKEKRVEEKNSDIIFMYLVDLGKSCVEKKAKDRPEMCEVLEKLIENVSSLAIENR